ncbi:hypothetical protein [Streptomyces sp. NPDC094049]|uniref:hypothetical protein n=1 Tax=Streptomyces sp. NPDC094049 TaxID=3154987 RepID=UPI00332A4CAE
MTVFVDPTHLAAAWQEAMGSPLTDLDGLTAYEAGSHLGRAHSRIWARPTRFLAVSDDYEATLAALRKLSRDLITASPTDTIHIRLTTRCHSG